jgi:hypothetical protein
VLSFKDQRVILGFKTFEIDPRISAKARHRHLFFACGMQNGLGVAIQPTLVRTIIESVAARPVALLTLRSFNIMTAQHAIVIFAV